MNKQQMKKLGWTQGEVQHQILEEKLEDNKIEWLQAILRLNAIENRLTAIEQALDNSIESLDKDWERAIKRIETLEDNINLASHPQQQLELLAPQEQ